ncbi:hypothetical protein K474DRAFT_1678259 [Panus rudis PR-1116 ss-1]|nr:hypothetical protein K474DRAFT_1678259 [Panus rudis PR-1116 ss-1]
MSHPAWKEEILSLHNRLARFIEEYDKVKESEEEGDVDKQLFVAILSDACNVVRRAEAQGNPELEDIVEAVNKLLIDAFDYAYDPSVDLYESIPSYAHGEHTPLIKDHLKMFIGQGMMESLFSFMKEFFARRPDGSIPKPGPGPWKKSRQPHPSTTPLSRFRRPFQVSATSDAPLAQTIYQARCEIYSNEINSPLSMQLSPGNSCLAIASAGGYKNRDPVLTFAILGDEPGENAIVREKSFTPGLADIARDMALDEESKLIFVGDTDRVKSYSWMPDEQGRYGAPIHTLRTDSHHGPLSVLPSGRILRAGKGSVAGWNMHELETHEGGTRIGEGKYRAPDSWRDVDAHIEPSTGSLPHLNLPLEDGTFDIKSWHLHKPTGLFLASTGDGEDSRSYSCVAIDLEHGGRRAKRFLGASGAIGCFSTSDGDPNIFLTSADDGHIRLYDIRGSLPFLTLDVGHLSANADAAVLLHPDGIPSQYSPFAFHENSVFSGGQKTECIKLWDIRAKKVVYDLSTGNNAVEVLAWDSKRSTLYAATECMYVDRLGGFHGYRHARKPNFQEVCDNSSESGSEAGDELPSGIDRPEPDDDEDMASDDDEEDEEEIEDDWDDEDQNWPKDAYHGENYYGKMYDAASHTLLRYHFTPDANPDIFPASGYSSVGDY